jgi:hypothetical protein
MNWKFQTISAGIEKQGIRDNDIQVFDKYRIASVVRESIQNSLDAVFDDKMPVRVEFQYGHIYKDEAQELFKIEKHVKACLNGESKGSEDYQVLSDMVGKIRENSAIVPILKISDYNTVGMHIDGAYDAFAFSRNVNYKKDETSAGSKGMGKSAFFSNSYLRTVLISSLDLKTGETLFQGIARLATHQLDDEDLYFKGFFGENDFQPLKSPLPGVLSDTFSRSEPGTTLGIIGVWEPFSEEIKRQFISAIIKSFWLAILNKKLEVKVNYIKIDSSNVYDLCCEYWPDYKGTKTGEKINPRQFMESYLGKVDHQKFEVSIDILGKVHLTLGKYPDFNGMISFFRKSNMLIETKSRGNPNHPGYAGVFVCEDEEGNKILKRLENPRHDQWSSKNYKHPKGGAALKSLEEFIAKCYNDFFSIQNENEITIAKLSEFIQIDHRKKSDLKPRSFEKKEKEIQVGVKKNATGGGGEKRIFGLRCHANMNVEGQWVYQVSFKGADYYPNVIFEVLVAGDSEKAGSDNEIPVIQIGDNLIEGNTNKIEISIIKGENKFSFILNDNEKHSLRLKLA